MGAPSVTGGMDGAAKLTAIKGACAPGAGAAGGAPGTGVAGGFGPMLAIMRVNSPGPELTGAAGGGGGGAEAAGGS